MKYDCWYDFLISQPCCNSQRSLAFCKIAGSLIEKQKTTDRTNWAAKKDLQPDYKTSVKILCPRVQMALPQEGVKREEKSFKCKFYVDSFIVNEYLKIYLSFSLHGVLKN